MKISRLPSLLALAVCFAAPAIVGAAESAWSLLAAPTYALPIIAGDFSRNSLFASSFGAKLGVALDVGHSSPLALRLDGAYSAGGFLPAEGVEVPGSLREASVLMGLDAAFPITEIFSFHASASGGFTYGSLSSGVGTAYGAARAGVGLEMKLSPTVTARLDAAFDYRVGLYGAVGASLGIGYRLPSPSRGALPGRPRLLEFKATEQDGIFPIFRSYYDDHSLGRAVLANTCKVPATDVRVSFFMRQYMDAPKECAAIPRLDPGQSVKVQLHALFNDRILDVTEPTKTTGEILIERGGEVEARRSATFLVYDRNALTWSDDRKAAAFVSSKDPWVLDLSGNILAAVKSARNPELPKNLQTAIALHEGLRLFGLGYVLSPNRPFATAAIDAAAIDSLKFPRQTLGFRSGDCADLSVLYASCFEAVGIETAFITVPGHILMALDLGLSPAELRTRSMDLSELIIQDGRVWLPLETTMRESGFLAIWKKGAAQWREASAKGTAALFPIHDAWKTYAPVGLPADGSTVNSPDQGSLVKVFNEELDKVVAEELNRRLAALVSLQQGSKPSTKTLNERGILYGKYGRLDEAEREFQAAAKENHLPAIVNLGNLAFLRSDYESALRTYEKAAKLSPDDPRLLVNIARAAAALGKTDLVGKTLAAVRKIDPAAADKYAGLAEGTAAGGTRAAARAEGGLEWF